MSAAPLPVGWRTHLVFRWGECHTEECLPGRTQAAACSPTTRASSTRRTTCLCTKRSETRRATCHRTGSGISQSDLSEADEQRRRPGHGDFQPLGLNVTTSISSPTVVLERSAIRSGQVGRTRCHQCERPTSLGRRRTPTHPSRRVQHPAHATGRRDLKSAASSAGDRGLDIVGGGTSLIGPTFVAALSVNTVPWRTQRRRTSMERWPVCRAIEASDAPLAAAVVANPARNECPPRRDCSMPASSAARRRMRDTDWPDSRVELTLPSGRHETRPLDLPASPIGGLARVRRIGFGAVSVRWNAVEVRRLEGPGASRVDVGQVDATGGRDGRPGSQRVLRSLVEKASAPPS
jgi:hypothetical protein